MKVLVNSETETLDPYGLSEGCVGGGYVFASALALDWSTLNRSAHANSVKEEVVTCLEQVGATLGRAGRTWKDVVRITCWLADQAYRAECHAEIKNVLGENDIAVAFVEAGLMGGCRVELEVMATDAVWEDPERSLTSMATAATGGNSGNASVSGLEAPLVYASAVAIDLKTFRRVVEADSIADETRVVFSQIETMLGLRGLGLRDVVKTTCYLQDESCREEFLHAYRAIFESGPFPARSAVMLGVVGDCRVQVEVVAAAAV